MNERKVDDLKQKNKKKQGEKVRRG